MANENFTPFYFNLESVRMTMYMENTGKGEKHYDVTLLLRERKKERERERERERGGGVFKMSQ